MTKKKTTAHEAPIEDYAPRPLSEAAADPQVLLEREDQQPDQIPDYHVDHPTLVIPDSVEAVVEQTEVPVE